MAAKRQPLAIWFWYLRAILLFVLALLGVSRGGLGEHDTIACSERAAQAIDEEISALIDAAHDRVVRALRERRTTLGVLARLLLEKEGIGCAELDELLKASTGEPPGPRAVGGAA